MISASAFILIGGKSDRFGSHKWQSIIAGKSVFDHIWDACSGFEHRFVIGKKKPNNLVKPFIFDELEIQAPINGLYTALKHSKTDWILLLSCDLPLIDADVFQTLWDTRTKEADAVIPVAYDRNQGTSALYHKRILPHLESTFQHADHSLYSLTEKLNSIKVEFRDDKRFWNMNTKKDFVEISNFIANKV